MQIPDSTQSRDHKEDHIKLPVMDALTIDTYVMVKLQIILFQQNSFEEFDCVSTYIADTIYAAQNFHNPSVTVSTLHAYDTLIVYRDQQLQEFWREKSIVTNSLIGIYHFSNHPLFII